jgi:hypothetical protein
MENKIKLSNINTLRNGNEEKHIEIDMSEFFPSEEERQKLWQKELDRRIAATNSEWLAEIKEAEEIEKRFGYVPFLESCEDI